MNLKQPFYMLKISSQYCGYQITVNGALVDENRDGSPLTIEYPVNQWVKSGDNAIEVFFLNTPQPGTKKQFLSKNSKLTCSLKVKEHRTEDNVTISTLNFSGATVPRKSNSNKINYQDNDKFTKSYDGSTEPGNYKIVNGTCLPCQEGDILISEVSAELGITASIHLTQNINLNTPFPKWRFFDGEEFMIHHEMTDPQWEDARAMMLVEYQKIWDVINSENFTELEKLLEARSLEYDQAFYREPGQSLNLFIQELKNDLADKDWPLKPLSLKYIDISVEYNKKIISLHGFDSPLGGAISLSHTKSNLAKTYPFYFSKINGEWKIVR